MPEEQQISSSSEPWINHEALVFSNYYQRKVELVDLSRIEAVLPIAGLLDTFSSYFSANGN